MKEDRIPMLRSAIRHCGCPMLCRLEAHLGRALSPEETALAARLPSWLGPAEALAYLAVKLRALPPPECGPEMVAAPARGAMKITMPRRMLGNASLRDGHLGRHRMEEADIFDRMEEAERQAAVRRKATPAPPFSPGQIAVARHYRALVERHDAGAIKCASLEADRGGGSRGGDFMDAFIAEGEELDRLRARIGTGLAREVRRARPSRRGAGARDIQMRALVDRVCIAQQSLSAVLEAYGWAADGAAREMMRARLAEALDRMQGYREAS